MREELEDTKWVIRIRKSKKDRQHHGQMKKDKRTNYDQCFSFIVDNSLLS